jgi:hypothetical protein
MSTSFIEYRGHGFWSFDAYTERLIEEVANLVLQSAHAAWEMELAAHWKNQASGSFRAWMHLNLDEFLNDERRRDLLVGRVLTAKENHPSGDPVHETAVLLLKLLNGEIKWDASSPLDYMVKDQRRLESR